MKRRYSFNISSSLIIAVLFFGILIGSGLKGGVAKNEFTVADHNTDSFIEIPITIPSFQFGTKQLNNQEFHNQEQHYQ